MADITKDSFNEANDFTKVVFQRGRDLMDFELNEFQDILRVFSARLGQVGVGLWQAAASISLPYSSDNGLEVVVSPTSTPNEVQINAGTFIVDGVVQDYLLPTTLVLPAPAGTVQYDIVYIAVAESEVADPNAVPQIGPTTVRRQLTTTVMTYRTASLPFDPSFPVNPATWLWQGQTRYYPIAVVTRPALTTVVTAADILDLRRQTPSRTLAEAARVVDFKLEALIAPSLETPVRDVNGIDNQLIVDINKASSASLVALNDVMTVRSRQQSGSAQTMATLTRYASTTTGVAGRLALGTNYALYGTQTLRFQDDNVVNTGYPAPVTNKFVPFSSVANGASVLRIGEQGAVVQNTTLALSAQNLLKSINSRVHVSVGDGTVSFGDFNGSNAIQLALDFYAAAVAAGATIGSYEIDVKRGTYVIAATINIPANAVVTLTGDNARSSVVQVSSAAGSGFALLTNSVVEFRRLQVEGGGGMTALVSVGSGVSFVTEDCIFEAASFGVVVQGANSLLFMRTLFRASPGVADTPLVQLRVGAAVSGGDYLFKDCGFYTQGTNDIPVVRVQGMGSYATSSTIRSVQFVGCSAALGGGINTRDLFNPSAVNTGLLDFSPNGANINNVYSKTGVDRVVIRDCAITATANAASDCLTALRITANPVGDFSGTLFTAGFFTVDYLQISGLTVVVDGTTSLSAMNSISPVIVGLYHAHIEIADVTIQNATTSANGINNGKIPYDAYTYFTPDGTVAPAPNTGARAASAVAGTESAAVAIANRWFGTTHYALTEVAVRNPQPTTLVSNLRIFGFERGSTSVHSCGGELLVHASGTYAYISDLEVSNYKNSNALTRVYAPDSRVRLMTSRIALSGVNNPVMDVRRVNMTGYFARQGAVVALTITNPGSGYTDGFYAGCLTSGVGANLRVNVLVQGGVVTQVQIANPGNGWTAGNTVSVVLPTGTGAQFTVTSVSPASQWLSGAVFAGASTELPSTSDAAYLLLSDRTTNPSFPYPSHATISLTDVDISGYQTESAVAQGAAIGCYEVGSDAISIIGCAPNVGRGIYLAAPVNSWQAVNNARYTSINITSCVVLPNSTADGNGMSGTITLDCGASQLLINNNTVSGSAVGNNGPVTVAQYDADYAGAMQVSGNVLACPGTNNVSLRFLCNFWPLGAQVVPRAVVNTNTCRLPNSGSGTLQYAIYFNNRRASGGGTLPNNDQLTLSLTNSRGLETGETAYGGTALHFVKTSQIIHNDAFLWTDT